MKLELPWKQSNLDHGQGAWGRNNFLPLVEPPSSFFVVVWTFVKRDIPQHDIYVPQDSSSGYYGGEWVLLLLSRVDRVHV